MVPATLSTEEIIQGAITQEEESVAAYHFALERVMQPATRALLERLIQEELGQIEKLRDLVHGKLESPCPTGMELKILLHFIKGEEITEIHSFRDALLFSIKKEQAAVEAYSLLSRLIEDPRAKRLFELLAQEELAHKRKVEALHEELVYQED